MTAVFPCGPAPSISQFPPLRVAHAPSATAEIGFVHFDRASEQRPILREGDSEPLREKPRRFLCHTQVAVELHARHALEAGHKQERPDEPVLIANLRAFHDCARLHTELLPALFLAATVGHGFVLATRLDIHRTAGRAAYAVRPSLLDEPSLSRCIVGEHLEHLLERDALPVRLSRCFSHDYMLPQSGGNVKRFVVIFRHFCI